MPQESTKLRRVARWKFTGGGGPGKEDENGSRLKRPLGDGQAADAGRGQRGGEAQIGPKIT